MPTAARQSSWLAFLLALAALAAPLIPLDSSAYQRMLHSHRGKVVLVDFWATWCEPCREELPKLLALSKTLPPGKFQLITVSADEPENEAAAATLLHKEAVPAPRYIKRTDDDQVFINAIDKKWSGALPALFLYDTSGALIARFIGESDPADVEAAIRKALR